MIMTAIGEIRNLFMERTTMQESIEKVTIKVTSASVKIGVSTYDAAGDGEKENFVTP